MTNKERLREYIEIDPMYQEMKSGLLSELSDFDEFSINHCKDIEDLLKENEELKAMIDKEDGCNHRRKQIFELKDKLCVALKDTKNLKQENQQLKEQLETKHNGFMASVEESCDLAKEIDLWTNKYNEEFDKNKELHNKIDKVNDLVSHFSGGQVDENTRELGIKIEEILKGDVDE